MSVEASRLAEGDDSMPEKYWFDENPVFAGLSAIHELSAFASAGSVG
jgi:hypothetical protein